MKGEGAKREGSHSHFFFFSLHRFQVIMSNFNHERWYIVCLLVGGLRGLLDESFLWCNQVFFSFFFFCINMRFSISLFLFISLINNYYTQNREEPLVATF